MDNMTKKEFREYIKKGPIILDGATGTNLMAAGMPIGVCPEKWVMDHPDVLLELQKAFVEAGTNIVYAPTFTGNRIKLEEYDLADDLEEINTTLVKLSKEAVGDKALVAGDVWRYECDINSHLRHCHRNKIKCSSIN